MRVLVTGGAGFIGSHLVEHFQGKADVRVLDSLRSGYRKNLDGMDVEFVEGDIRDRDAVDFAMQGVDYVCVTKITKEGNNYYLEANLVNIETGKISNPATQYGELTGGSLSNMLAACEKLAAELVGKKVYPSSYTKSQSTASSTTSYSETIKPKPTPQSFSTAQISSFDPNIKVEIISCTRNEYDVLLEYKITYTGLGDISSYQILLGDSHNAFFDNLGNSYKGYVSLGQKGSSHATLFAPLMENIPTKGSVKYSRVPRDANSLTVKLLVQSAQTGRGYITLKNVRIY